MALEKESMENLISNENMLLKEIDINLEEINIEYEKVNGRLLEYKSKDNKIIYQILEKSNLSESTIKSCLRICRRYSDYMNDCK